MRADKKQCMTTVEIRIPYGIPILQSQTHLKLADRVSPSLPTELIFALFVRTMLSALVFIPP